MKKRYLILIVFITFVMLCLFSGLLFYAFDVQRKKDLQNISGQELEPTTAPTKALAPVTSTPSPTPSPTSTPIPEEPKAPIVLGFSGDVNLDDVSYPIAKYKAANGDLTKCLSSDLLDEMNAADIMMLNNEFAFSTRGTKEKNKSFTFRSDPQHVEILTKMGVDIVSLANNHALDFGPDALIDTFATLDGADIDYIGAGDNLDRAKAPIYYTVGDKKIAYVAASRVVPDMSWYASEDKLGMLGTYDSTIFVASIEEAAENSDYVIAFVHWGIERNNYPEAYQRNLAKQYIDAGADAVIGCHPHVMQGVEFYKGKPIAYSLGNFWFGRANVYSGMIKLYLDPEDTVRVQLLPVMAKDTYTYLLTDASEQKEYYNFMEELSPDVNFDESGFITQID